MQPATSDRALPKSGAIAFKALDREDGSFLDDGQLADLEPADFFGYLESETHVFPLFGGEFWAQVETFGGHVRAEPGGGLDEFDPFAAEFLGDRPKDGMGVLGLEFQKEGQSAEVGSDVEEIARSDLARHDTFADFLLLERLNHFSELAHLDPGDVIDEFSQGRVSFAIEGHGDNFAHTHGTGLAGQ